ncbi:hypothetical protein NQZ79_g1753 [Umbelopsis isabellina]|nr:hypothetical protein NQZ79_g1753 [Umbelopsis isabellina]
MKFSLFSTALCLVTVAFAAPTQKRAANIVPGTNYDRIVIFVLENTDYSTAAANPYLSSLAQKHTGVTLTNYLAITHPSQPNYVAMISGSPSGVLLDFDSTINRKNIVDLLEAKGISWKSYQQAYPGNCNTATSTSTYYRKHNPFISFPSITGNATRCAKIVNSDQLDTDIANNAVPQINNDAHNTNVTYAASWLQSYLEPRISNPAFSTNTLFVLTFDESANYLNNNQVFTVLFGPAVQRSSLTDGNKYNHYSILKSVEDNWNLGNLGQNDVSATPFVVKDQATNGASEKIKNVVLFVLENRSFDRMLGWANYTNLNGLTGKEYNLVNPADPTSTKIYAGHHALLQDPLDPPHGIDDVTKQITGNPNAQSITKLSSVSMGGFVADFAASLNVSLTNTTALGQIMNSFDPQTIPITYALAQNYMVMDNYFSSFPGSTMPNRMFVHSATSHGEINTDGSKYIAGYPQNTIYNNLAASGISWTNYFEEIPSLLVFDELRTSLGNYKQWDSFKSDAAAGNLPAVTFLDPAYFSILNCVQEDDNHPPADIAEGEAILKQIYETLRASPQWNETLLIVTYDEHGGYFDHVPTPLSAPNPDNITVSDFDFTRLGVRVPTLLISPWIEAGSVLSKPNGPQADSQFEHSSIPATIKKWAATFEGAISLDKPRTDCPTTLPAPPPPAVSHNSTGPLGKKIHTLICDALLKILGLD